MATKSVVDVLLQRWQDDMLCIKGIGQIAAIKVALSKSRIASEDLTDEYDLLNDCLGKILIHMENRDREIIKNV